jgi:hypothetical protein
MAEQYLDTYQAARAVAVAGPEPVASFLVKRLALAVVTVYAVITLRHGRQA